MTRYLLTSTPAEPLSAPIEHARRTSLDAIRTPGFYFQPASINMAELARAKEALAVSAQHFFEALRPAAEAAVEVMRAWAEQLREAGLVAGTPPTDPRERALWAKRNRGTGPATPTAWHKR